jgi:L-threonine kinase
MTIDIQLPQISRAIFHEYPRPIREVYAAVVGDAEPASRHRRLLALGETSIAWFASLAFSDYRSQRYRDPDPRVEDAVGRAQRPSLGQYLELWRAASAATQPAMFDLKQPEVDQELPSCQRFFAAVAGIEDAIELEANNIGRAISVRLDRQMKKVTWFDFWGKLVEYRNRAEGHSTSHAWPVSHPDYYRLITPILEAALTEALSSPNVGRLFSEHPLAHLTDIGYQDGLFCHRFAGEDSGLPFQTQVKMEQSVADLWALEAWPARVGSSFLLGRTPSGGYEVRAVFRDLVREGVPPALDPPEPAQRPAQLFQQPPKASTTEWAVATASAPGTCGEFAQGILPGDVNFHVTSPISKSATVRVRLRPARETRIEGLTDTQDKIGVSLRRALETLDAEPLEIVVDHWTDLDVGKGMGSSTADVIAAASALAAALGRTLSPEELAAIATSIESSDGTMYPGLAVVNHKTGDALRRYEWWPEFVLVMIVPAAVFNTESARFDGKESLAAEYADMLSQFDKAIETRDPLLFARQSTRSAELNQRYVPNPYWIQLAGQIDHYGAIGANVAHTGTVCGLIFENTSPGMQAAAAASIDLAAKLPSSVRVELTTTPPSPHA